MKAILIIVAWNMYGSGGYQPVIDKTLMENIDHCMQVKEQLEDIWPETLPNKRGTGLGFNIQCVSYGGN